MGVATCQKKNVIVITHHQKGAIYRIILYLKMCRYMALFSVAIAFVKK